MSQRLAPAALVVFAFAGPILFAGCGGSSDPASCTPATESCNGADDDCDGLIDEADATGCTVYFEDADDDGGGGASACLCAPAAPYTVTVGGDCDDGDAAVREGATELCNGRDDDCDVQVDEDFAVGDSCQVGVGACQAFGLTVCAGASAVTCDAVAGDPSAELCDGIDNDCDGATDETGSGGCSNYWYDADHDGYGGSFAACACASPGAWTVTNPDDCDDADAALHPGAVEACNGVDDDCTAATPDGSGESTLGESCDGAGDADLCADGTIQCQLGAMVCGDGGPSAVDLCNGSDDDCDAATPDGAADPANGAACCPSGNLADCANSGGATRCQAGAGYCSGGMILCAGAVQKSTDFCDGVDNDCDGLVDDVAQLGNACTDGSVNTTGACTAAYTCAGVPGPGPAGLTCTQLVGPTAELCNGVDDDCDGQVDADDFDLVAPSNFCITAGACVGTSPSCTGAGGWRCFYGGDVEVGGDGVPVATEQLCNGVDGNCNGQVDESFPLLGQPCSDSGVGACRSTGTYGCGADAVSVECNLTIPGAAPSPETCNGVDDDCNGTVDEMIGPLCPNQNGVCAGARQACGAGAGWLACTNATYEVNDPRFDAAVELQCDDGLDNDCDGVADTSDPDCPWAHTIAIDGTNDFTGQEQFATSSMGYTGWITWDADAIYVAVQGAAIGNRDGNTWLVLYFGAGGPGSTAGVTYNTQGLLLPFAATHHLRLRIAPSYFDLMAWDGTQWAAGTLTGGTFAIAGSLMELRLPRASLGSPTTLSFVGAIVRELVPVEWTYAGVPASAFSDAYDPNFVKYLQFDLAGSAPPGSYPAVP